MATNPNPAAAAAPAGATPAARRPAAVIELGAADLEGQGVTFCPNPRMTLWSTHPRVFIDVGSTGEGKCPYCGTVYRLRAGEHFASRH